MHSTEQATRALAAASMIAIATLGLGTSVGAAAAAERVVSGNLNDDVLPEHINTDRRVSLTLKKTPANPYDDVAPGELPPGLVSGVTFTIERVNDTDITTSDGYDDAKKLTVQDARDRGLTLAGTAVTGEDGVAVVNGLAPGLYLVTETAPYDPSREYKTSTPFLVLLPLGLADGEGFNYDSVVVVKNAPSEEFSEPPGTPTTTPREPGDPPRVPPWEPGNPPGNPPGETPPGSTSPPGTPGEPGSPPATATTTPGCLYRDNRVLPVRQALLDLLKL